MSPNQSSFQLKSMLIAILVTTLNNDYRKKIISRTNKTVIIIIKIAVTSKHFDVLETKPSDSIFLAVCAVLVNLLSASVYGAELEGTLFFK